MGRRPLTAGKPSARIDDSIQARIANALPSLTPAHRQMAQFVSANLFRSATMRIDEFANAAGVSNATANRFARALGFDGYPQFRVSLVLGFEATLAPVERLRDALESPASSRELLVSALDGDIENLQAIRRSLDAPTCERVVEALLGARRIFIVGFGASAYLAGLMEYGLDPYCRHVEALSLIGGATHAARHLFDVTKDDLVVGIVFPRYVRDTVMLVRRARARGATVLALTDGPTSPLAPLADIALYVRAQRQLGANSDAAVLSLIQALCGAIALRAPTPVRSAADMMEFLLPWIHHPDDDIEAPPVQPTKKRRLK
jgi:DNA-binding MurR/RpiR family transcriptional regulator